MSDTGQDIEIADNMTLTQLIEINRDTDGRMSFKVDSSGTFALVMWVNYYKKNNKREKNPERGCWKLLEHQQKKVVLI